MPKPKIILIAAVAKNNVIGSNNTLPWYLPEDLRRFKKLTENKTVLMGKKTYDSIIARNGKPLPNRKNLVLSRNTSDVLHPDVAVYNRLEELLQNSDYPEIYVIGGGQIYNQLIDSAHKLHITHVHQDVDGDVFFPVIDPAKWKKVYEEPYAKFSFADYIRI